MKSLKVPTLWVAIAIAMASTIGCEDSANSGASDMDSLATQLEQNNKATADAAAAEQVRVAAEAKAAADKAAAEQAAQAALEANQPAAAPENETTNTITVKNPQGLLSSPEAKAAMAGIVGKKQRRNQVEGPLRYYGAMANARIIAMDRALGWQIKSSMDVWVNTHDGKYPKTTEEFMKEIVEPNMIELPELEPNQEFFYDPEDHELKIAELIDEPANAAPVAETAPLEQ